MEASIAEILILAAVGYGLYKLLRPIQRRLETAIYRFLSGKNRDERVIDVHPIRPNKKNDN
jgi:hypothetical protein